MDSVFYASSFVFSKEQSHFLLSMKSSEQFLLSLPPGQNCSNDKWLLPKYKISKLG